MSKLIAHKKRIFVAGDSFFVNVTFINAGIMSHLLNILTFSICLLFHTRQIDQHSKLERKSLNIDSITRKINLLAEKTPESHGERKLKVNDSLITIIYISARIINYKVTVGNETEYLDGGSEIGYTRKIVIDGNPIFEIATYYGNGTIRNFQYIYSYNSIKYPVGVYEDYDKTGRSIKRIDPSKVIHFNISDVERLVERRGGDIMEATLNFSPDHVRVWRIRYYSKKDGLSDFIINPRNGKVLGQKHHIVIYE